MSIAQLLVFGLSVAAAKGIPTASLLGGGDDCDNGGLVTANFLDASNAGGGVVTADVLGATNAGGGLVDLGVLPGTGTNNVVDLGLLGNGNGGSKKGGNILGVNLGGLITLSVGVDNQQARSIFSTAGKYGKCNDMNDVFKIWLSVGKACGHVIDCWIPEMGTWFANACMCMSRMVGCCNDKSKGGPLIDLQLLGGGSKKLDMCKSSYLSNIGYSCYSGKWDRSMISSCGCDSSERRVNEWIHKYTKGRGIECLSGPRRCICESMLWMGRAMDRNSSGWCKDDIMTMMRHISIIIGVIGNSYQDGLGSQIAGQMWSYCSGTMKKYGWGDCNQYSREIIIKIQECSKIKYCFKHCLKCKCDENDEFDRCDENCGCQEGDDKCSRPKKCQTSQCDENCACQEGDKKCSRQNNYKYKDCDEDCGCNEGDDKCTRQRKSKKLKNCDEDCDCEDGSEECSNQKTEKKKSKKCDSKCDCDDDDEGCSNRQTQECDDSSIYTKKVKVVEKEKSKKSSHKSKSSDCGCDE